MRLNPFVEAAPTYPLSRVGGVRADARARGAELVDLSLGQPSDPIPPFLADALTAAVAATPFDAYPTSEGLPALREAIAGWVARRFGATLDPDGVEPRENELRQKRRFHLGREVDGMTPFSGLADPINAGLRVVELPLSAAGGWLPDPDDVPWDEVAIVWLTSPHNPTGAIAPPELTAALAERCRAHGALLAVDEAYSELWFEGAPPGSALALEDRSGVVAFHSLSKRTGVPGLRSGFAAGDPQILARMKRHRVDVGTTPQTFVQRASIAAWSDEAHVDAGRASYAARRALLRDAFARGGLEHAGGAGGMFLWLRVPEGDDVAAFESLAARGVLTVPGSWLGPGGAGHLRASFTRPLAELERAAELLAAGSAART